MANIAKTRFLAAASHDLRQPMHALGLFIAALAEQNLDPRATHLIEQIGASASAMEDLLDSLPDISRLDAGVLEPRRQPVPLQMLFDRVRTNMQRDASDRNVKLFVRRTEAWVESDPVLLERIVANLVSHAVRYAPGGRVLVCARKDEGRLRIEVRDNGMGIPRESHAVIFQEFVQLGNPERARCKGLGLGLAIVSRLTALLDHQLSLRSAPGRGSVFAVTLPTASSTSLALPAAERTPGDLAGTAVPSCTACEWDLGDAPQPCRVTPGAYTIRFLLDQQDCLFWYLYVRPDGTAPVLCSPIPFDEPGLAVSREVVLANSWLVAPDFEAFVYRFWIENELWELLDEDAPELTAAQRAYVEHYAAAQAAEKAKGAAKRAADEGDDGEEGGDEEGDDERAELHGGGTYTLPAPAVSPGASFGPATGAP